MQKRENFIFFPFCLFNLIRCWTLFIATILWRMAKYILKITQTFCSKIKHCHWCLMQWRTTVETIWAPNLEKLEKYYFLKVKSATKFNPWKQTRSQWLEWVLLMLSFMTNQNITSVTDLHRGDIALHSAYKIDYH